MARKKKPKNEKFVSLTSWVTQEQRKKVKDVAKTKSKEHKVKITESSIIRELINNL